MRLFLKKQGIRRHQTTRSKSNFRQHLFAGAIFFIVVCISIFCLRYVFSLPLLTISDVFISGGETVSHDAVRELVLKELNGTYFRFIPKKFSYTYPHDRIVEVLAKNPRIHNLTVSRDAHNSLHIRFDEYLPHALWCVEGNNSRCAFIDIEGIAYMQAPELTGNTLVRYEREGTQEIPDGQVIASTTLHEIDQFLMRVENEFGLRITMITYAQNGDMTCVVNGGGKILISSKKDFTATFENLGAVLSSKEFKHIEPGSFNYIDVRFENKVFIKEEFEDILIASSTATSS